MNPLVIIQVISAVAGLIEQVSPLLTQLKTAMETNDEAAALALLVKLEAVNDQLGAA